MRNDPWPRGPSNEWIKRKVKDFIERGHDAKGIAQWLDWTHEGFFDAVREFSLPVLIVIFNSDPVLSSTKCPGDREIFLKAFYDSMHA